MYPAKIPISTNFTVYFSVTADQVEDWRQVNNIGGNYIQQLAA